MKNNLNQSNMCTRNNHAAIHEEIWLKTGATNSAEEISHDLPATLDARNNHAAIHELKVGVSKHHHEWH